MNKKPPLNNNDWADFWRNIVGVNPFPADTQYRVEYPLWSEWKDKPIPIEQHEKWKNENAFEKGIAILPGKIWFRNDKKDLYIVFIDLDNQKAIDEVCSIFGVENLQELSEIVIVEQHKDDATKAHIYFYSTHIFKKKSSDANKYQKEIDNNDIPAIEIKGLGSHGIAFCSNSKHKNGYRYEIIGTKEPQTFGKEIEDKLFEVYQKYGQGIDKNGKIPIEKLFEDDFVVYEGHNRHEALLRVMESLIQRNKDYMPLEQIRQLAWKWNQKHCSPLLDDKEFERQWMDALKFIEKKKREKTLKYGNQVQNKEISEMEIPIYKIVQQTPSPRGYFIDRKNHEIRFGIKYDDNFLSKKSITDVIPINITVYNNPLFPKLNPIEVQFNNQLKIGPSNTVNEIIRVLESKGHILNKNGSQDALNSIISAFNDRNLIEYRKDVTTPGYYLINNKLLTKETTQELKVSKEDAMNCCIYLNQLAGNGWRNKNIFPSVIKWGIIAPFSFAIKYNSDNWIPWLFLYGQGRTGKTTLGNLILYIWNLNRKNNSLGFNHIDSIARFGNIASKDTYPKLISEIGSLLVNSYGKYTTIVESIKHSVENVTVRGKYVDSSNTGAGSAYNSYQEIPALTAMIFTSNYQPINDAGFNRRLISIHFPNEEKKEAKEQENFKHLLEENKNYLKTLGNFVAEYIIKNPNRLIEKPWVEISEDLLIEFYQFADQKVPDWITFFEEQRDAVDESTEITHFGLRAFFVNKINDAYSRFSRMELDQIEGLNATSLESKIKYCLKNDLISFLHTIKNEYEEIWITVDIMKELKKNDLENVTSLKDVGALFNFKYVNKTINGKKMRVLQGTLIDLITFLDSQVK